MNRRPAPGFVARLIDQAVAAVSPVWAMRRQAARNVLQRQTPNARLRYDAARMDRVRSTPRSGSADGDLLPDLRVLREKSRALVRDDAHAAAAIRVLVDNVVGDGITPQSALRPETSGLTQAQCDDWNAKAEQLWRETCATQADANDVDDFSALTRLVYRTRLVDGEALAHRLVVPGRGPLATCYELIDADRLEDPPTPLNVRYGVEIGDRGEPVAYWLLPHHPDDLRFTTAQALRPTNPERYVRRNGDFWNVLHVYRRERPGQSRGLPLLTPAMPLFEHLHHYLDSEIIAARANANVAMFIRRPLDPAADPDVRPVDDDAGRDGELVYHETLEPGTIEYLNEGEEIQPFLPARPGSSFDSFVTRILRAICAALDLPYEMVAKDFGGMNYSSARVALLEARRGFEIEQDALVGTWLRPVWENMVREAIAVGELPTYPEAMRRNPRAFLHARWIRPAWGWVDPVKEIESARQAIAANLSTPDIEASRAGLDAVEVLEARARFLVAAREIEARNNLAPGTLTSDGAAAPAPAAPAPAGEQEDSAEDDAEDAAEDQNAPAEDTDQ